METPRTESELREFYQDFSVSSLKFAINLNRFLRFFCTEIGIFLLYLIILTIPMIIYHERVLQQPLMFGLLFTGIQATCFRIATKDTEKLKNDIDECDFKITIFKKIIKEKNS